MVFFLYDKSAVQVEISHTLPIAVWSKIRRFIVNLFIDGAESYSLCSAIAGLLSSLWFREVKGATNNVLFWTSISLQACGSVLLVNKTLLPLG